MRDTAPPLEIVWIDDPAALAPLAVEWQALADRVGADIYFMPDWQQIWWCHFGQGRQLACQVARDPAGQLVGVLPFVLERLRVGPLPLRLARLAGIDAHSIFFRFAADSEQARALLETALAHLTGPLGCDAVSFSPCSEIGAATAQIRDAAADLGLFDRADGVHTVAELPGSGAAFLAALTGKRRKHYRRLLNKLTREHGARTGMTHPGPEEFGDFVDFHNRQWQAIGRGGHFTDWPGSAEFYADLARHLAPQGRLRVHRVTGDDGPLAATFYLVAGRTAYARLPAQRLEPEYQRLSVGTIEAVAGFLELSETGVRLIEDGRGEYGYKLAYGGQLVGLRRLVAHPRSWSARQRVRALIAWADLVNLIAYRLWFVRLAPRLRRLTGAAPRPLPHAYVRTRI